MFSLGGFVAIDESMEEVAVAILFRFPVYSKAIFLPVSRIRITHANVFQTGKPNFLFF